MWSILQACKTCLFQGSQGYTPRKLDALRLNLRPFSLKEVTVCKIVYLYIIEKLLSVLKILYVCMYELHTTKVLRGKLSRFSKIT